MAYWSEFVQSPPGFYGKDIAIDIISALVVLLICYFSFKNYLLDKQTNKKHLLLAIAFAMLGGSFLVKVLTNIASHKTGVMDQTFIVNLLGIRINQYYPDVLAIGFLTYALLTLFGFYALYALSANDRLSMNYIIIAYFIVISTYFSRFNYYLLYFTAFLFIAAITRRYIFTYIANKHENTKYLAVSFALIALSQFTFIFTSTDSSLYTIAELIQLAGYGVLLYTFISVLKHAGKKNKN
jgi:hypothetical protein